MNSLTPYPHLAAFLSNLGKETKKIIRHIFKLKIKNGRDGASRSHPRKFGSLSGKIHMAKDFDSTPKELNAYM